MLPQQHLSGKINKSSTWGFCLAVLSAAFGLLLMGYPLTPMAMKIILGGWGLIFFEVAHFFFTIDSQTVGDAEHAVSRSARVRSVCPTRGGRTKFAIKGENTSWTEW